MTNPLLHGPYPRRRGERVEARPGEAIVFLAGEGVSAIGPSRRMPPVQALLGTRSYWRISLKSAQQTVKIEVPAASPRDAFDITMRYEVQVNDPAGFYKTTTADIDPLDAIQSRVRATIRAEAATVPATESSGLQHRLATLAFVPAPHLSVVPSEVVVQLSEATKARILKDAEHEDRLADMKREAELQKKQEEHRFDIVNEVADMYELKLDPWFRRALALDAEQSPDTILAMRERLIAEQLTTVQKLGDVVEALHKIEALGDATYDAWMNLINGVLEKSRDSLLRGGSLGVLVPEKLAAGPVLEVEATTQEVPKTSSDDAGSGPSRTEP